MELLLNYLGFWVGAYHLLVEYFKQSSISELYLTQLENEGINLPKSLIKGIIIKLCESINYPTNVWHSLLPEILHFILSIRKRQVELESEIQSLQKANLNLENLLEATKVCQRQEVSQLSKIHAETLKVGNLQLKSVVSKFFFNIYLFAVLDVSCSIQTLTCSMWDLVPWAGNEPGPLHWKGWLLATGPPGMSLLFYF